MRDEEGKPYTIRYQTVNAMLLDEFLKVNRKVEAQDPKIESLEAVAARLESTVAKQAAQIEKVRAQIQAGQPTTRAVENR